MTPEAQVGGSGQVWKIAFQLMQFGVFFAIVLALAYVSSKFLGKRLAPGGSGRHFRLLDQLPLGPNRGLFLVAVAGKVIVVGLADGGLSLICEIKDPESVRSLVQNVNPAGGTVAPLTGRFGAAPLSRTLWSRAGDLGIDNFARKLREALGGVAGSERQEGASPPEPRAEEGEPHPGPQTDEFPGQIRQQIKRLKDLSRRRGDGNADD